MRHTIMGELRDKVMEELREKVRELRRKKAWTQEDLAREVEVSLSTVQRWEKRGGKPTRLARRELARLFEEAGILVGGYNGR